MAQVPVAPLTANELQLLETSDYNHKWFKRYIKTLLEKERLAAEDWKTAQDDHMKLSLELQREQTALALIREMLADNLVGTVDDVEQQVKTVIQKAMELAANRPDALPSHDPPYCKKGAFKATAPDAAQIRTVSWRRQPLPLQRLRLEQLDKKLPLDEQRVDQLEKNVVARKLACEKLREQAKSMVVQCERMKRVRKEIGNALKFVWTDEVGRSRTVRRRFAFFQEQAETRASNMARSTADRLTKLINDGAHLAQPQGAVTWLNSWAQLGKRSHATPLCQTDYKLEAPKVLYTSGDDDDDAQQAAGPSGAPQPPGGGVAQAVDQARVKLKRDKFIMVLQKHVEERTDYILGQYNAEASRLRLWWDRSVKDQISEHGNLVVEATRYETGAMHYLNLHDPDIKDTWLEWGDAQNIPHDVIEEMMATYIDMINRAIKEKIVPVLKDKYGWQGAVEYKTASELDALYNEGRPSLSYRDRPLMKSCLLFGASRTTYKFHKSSTDRQDDHDWGRKFEDREGEFQNWFYNRERTIGFVTNLEHGLPTANLIAEGYLKAMDFTKDDESGDESSDDGALDLQGMQRVERSPEDEAARAKHLQDFLNAQKVRDEKQREAKQKKANKERGRYWLRYVKGVNEGGGFQLENQGAAKEAESWLITHHKQWFEDKKKQFKAQRKEEQDAARKAQAEELAWQEEFDALGGPWKNGNLQELDDL